MVRQLAIELQSRGLHNVICDIGETYGVTDRNRTITGCDAHTSCHNLSSRRLSWPGQWQWRIMSISSRRHAPLFRGGAAFGIIEILHWTAFSLLVPKAEITKAWLSLGVQLRRLRDALTV
jgi:hypothetical protein